MNGKMQFADGCCLFTDHFKQFLATFTNQNFPSVRISVCLKETAKFLLILLA